MGLRERKGNKGILAATDRKSCGEKATAVRMLVLGLLMAAVGFMLRQPGYSAGVLMALPVSLGFYRWLVRAAEGAAAQEAREAQNIFLRRALIRMGIFFVMLLLASFGGPAFLLGVLSGLILQMLSYMMEALLFSWRKI